MATIRTLESLLHVLKETDPKTPKFTLLLGSGASVSSGIKTAAQLIQEWRIVYDSQAHKDADLAKNQDWYEAPTEYGSLFEHLFPRPASRREFIETCIADASPSWGYLYLADLVQQGFFKTILTTSFDDLINEACLYFTPNLRPLVCSHDASINLFRLNSPRPKIIKLHGDFLFDSIKNTPTEVSSLEENTRQKIGRLAEDTGLIVVGYAGNDESIMSCIQDLLRDPTKFPHGIYWCVQNPKRISSRVKTLCGDSRFYLVEIENFDRMLAEAHQALVGTPPSVISAPFEAISSRISKLLGGLALTDATSDTKHATIARDFGMLGEAVGASNSNAISIDLPSGFAGALRFARTEYAEAIPLLLDDLRTRANVGALVLLFECFRYHWDKNACDEAISVLEKGASAPQPAPPQWLLNATLSLIHAGKFEAAERICSIADIAFPLHPESLPRSAHYNKLNRFQMIVHQGKQLSDVMRDEIQAMLNETKDHTVAFACLVLLGRHDSAIDTVKKNLKRFSPTCTDWPIVKLMPTAEANQLRGLVGTGHPHLGNLNFNLRINIAPTR